MNSLDALSYFIDDMRDDVIDKTFARRALIFLPDGYKLTAKLDRIYLGFGQKGDIMWFELRKPNHRTYFAYTKILTKH